MKLTIYISQFKGASACYVKGVTDFFNKTSLNMLEKPCPQRDLKTQPENAL